jgi:transglutaminase-like putative cysteine protease
MTGDATTSGARTGGALTGRAAGGVGSAPAPPPPPPDPGAPRAGSWLRTARTRSWPRAVGAGVALLAAGAPVGAVVQGTAWWGYAGGVVALVVLVGVVGGTVRWPWSAGVAAVQLGAVAGALTALFADSGVLRVLPGRGAVGDLAALLAEAGTQIRTGVAPVPATPAMLLLVTGAFGLGAVAVHAVAVGARAPAAAGILLLAVFAVPTALAEDLLPAWMPAAAAAGFGLLLLAGPGVRALRRAPGGVVVTAAAVALALGVGAATDGIGTAGRLGGAGAPAGRAGDIGLSPFTALRGQLQQSTPTDLFRVAGLPRPTYLRALTLNSYVPDSGWQPSRPGPGTPLTGGLPAAGEPGDRATVEVENVGFRDYWLPLFGEPLRVDGVAGDGWAYDPASGTAFSSRPRREDGWTQEALLPAPSVEALRAAGGAAGGTSVDPAFLSTDGIDPRVAAIAADVTSGAATDFDRAVALNRWFSGPDSGFTYDLSTGPGGGDDAMVEFLTRGRRGYCEQFASAMTAMLRTVGVPARVAVGFTAGRDDGAVRVVSTADAHAWVEAWLPGAGWTTFDPTPLSDGRAVVPPYVADADGAGDDVPEAAATAPPEQPEAATPWPGPSPGPDPAADAPAVAEPPAAAPPAAPGPSALLPVLLGLAGAAAVAAVVAAPALLRVRRRRHRLAAAAAGGPGAADAAWDELLAESADRGAPGRATDTVRAAARRLADGHGLDEGARRALGTVVGIVEESWYGGVDAAPDALTAPLRAVLDAVAAGTPRGVRGTLLPRSVVGAPGHRAPRGRDGGEGSGDRDDADAPDVGTDDAATVRR